MGKSYIAESIMREYERKKKYEAKIQRQELAKFIKENYEDKYLYNGDFISFVIYLNRKKVFSKDEDEIFSEFDFNKLIIHPTKDDIDLENGLKITNIIFEIEKGR